MTDEAPITSRQLRERYQISEPTVYRWVAAGCPHGRRQNGKKTHLYFYISEVDAWLRPPEQEDAA